MKKLLLLTIVIVVSLVNLNAQSVVLGKLYVGGKIGYGSVSFNSTDPTVKDFAERTYLNLAYGIVAGYKLDAKLSIQAEGVYAQYSANNIKWEYIYSSNNPLITGSGVSTVDHVDMELYYVDIPVTARYSFGSGALAPYAYVGVNWGINVQGYSTITRIETDPVAGSFSQSYNDDITDLIRYNEFAPLVGAGLNINMGNKITVFGDLRYKIGVQNVSNVQNGLGFKFNALWLSAGAAWNF